jgi:hypothetical protein
MEKKWRFFVWLLPVLWGGCSLLHYHFPGDEYGMYGISSIVGVWAIFIVKVGDVNHPMFPASIAVAGAIIMAGVGWFMDWMRIWRKLWGIIFAICAIGVFVLSVLSYPSIEKALSKNGSWWAYILFSINIGVYLSVILTVNLTCIGRLWKKIKNTKDTAT